MADHQAAGALSPNHGERRGGATPDMVVLHYTAMESAAAARERLCDPAAEVSAHYLIAADGEVAALVPEERRAWHAGVARWGAVTDVNSHSIGIELANRGDEPFAEAQMRALEGLLAEMLPRWRIVPERVVGHACIAPGRKVDPGPRFDWRRLALQGLAVWLDCCRPGGLADAGTFQRVALAFGYPTPATGAWDPETLAVWQAFAARFRPGEAAGPPTGPGVGHLERLAARWPVQDPVPPA